MDEFNVSTAKCKDLDYVCYTNGCYNHASRVINLQLTERVQCKIYVCDTCLPKYHAHQAHQNDEHSKLGDKVQ